MLIEPVWVLSMHVFLTFDFSFESVVLNARIVLLQGCPGFSQVARRSAGRPAICPVYFWVWTRRMSVDRHCVQLGRTKEAFCRTKRRSTGAYLFFFFVPVLTFPSLIVYVWDPLRYVLKIVDLGNNTRVFN